MELSLKEESLVLKPTRGEVRADIPIRGHAVFEDTVLCVEKIQRPGRNPMVEYAVLRRACAYGV